MSDIERIDQRLSAVERAVVDRDVELDELADLATLAEDLERLEARLEEHERRLAELEGTVDSIDGFVGNVESVNGDVERQADAAIAAVDRLEYRIDEFERVLEERGVVDGADATADEPGADAPMLESADADADAVVGSRADESGRTTRFDGHGTESPASGGTGDDAPFGGPDDAEATAGALLEAPDEETDAEADDGAAVQEVIRRRLAGSNDEGEETADPDDESGDASSEADEESTALFASLRDRLP